MTTAWTMEAEARQVEQRRATRSPRRIKVLHVSQSTVAGVETHILQILANIDGHRFDSHLVCPPDTPLAHHAEGLGATVVPVALERDPSVLADLRALVAVRSVIRRGDFDVVHTHSSKGGFIGRLAATLAGHPRVVHTPNAFYYIGHRGLKRLVYRSLERMARPWTDRLVATSISEQASAVEDLGFSLDVVRQINNAIELPDPALRNGSHAAANTTVLFAGRVGHQKNPEMFVRMSALLARRRPDARFAMIGLPDADPHAGRIRTQIEESGLANRYRLDGWLAREETLRRIAECAVFVIPSRYEGCCYIAAEAMALGVPVVATDVPGLREVVEHGESGFLVPLDDDEAAAERVGSLLDDPDLRRRMGERSIERVERLFNVKTNIKQLERTYLELLGENE